jgi:hypothetical protein
MIDPETAIWLLLVSVVVYFLWLTHFALSVRLWLRERSARSFRNAYLALMIQTGMTSIVLSRAARTWPAETWILEVAVWLSPVLTWMLLSGGVVAVWTWLSPRRRL